METAILDEKKEYNQKLFPYYKMFSWDLMFYYVISFMFLTTVKGFNASQILLIDAFYTLSKFLLQIPLVGVVDKLGKRKSLIIANISVALYMLLILFAVNIYMVILAGFFGAFGFLIKSLSESSLLYDSIPESPNRNKLFAKIEGKGGAFFFSLEAITSCLAGFLFAISPYLPVLLASIFCMISAFLAFRFNEIVPNVHSSLSSKQYHKNLKQSFRFIMKSKRLRSLILFLGVSYGFINLLVTLRKSLFYDIEVPVEHMGIFFAVLGIFSSIASARQNQFHQKYRNKTLTVLTIMLVSSCLLAGLVVILKLPYLITLVLVLLAFAIQYIVKGFYFTFNKKYLNSFSTADLRTKIYSVNNLFEAICSTIASFASSQLLKITSTAYAFIIISLVFCILLVLILDYMKTRVGLKPEEYKKDDIPIPLN